MKYLAIIFSILTLVSCSKDNFKSELEDSREVWLKFKRENNNTYSYTVETFSWVGTSSSTTIYVKNGQVTGRSFKSYMQDKTNGQKQLVQSWLEDQSHLVVNKEGADPVNLDEIYERAREWLKADKKENDLSFETKNDGMISSCGYIPKNCADDCFRGINILEIKAWDGVSFR